MKLEKVTTVETNVVELEVSVDAEVFGAAVDASYKKNVGKMTVQGFRKGKAPRKMVEKIYGVGVFYDDAINAVYPQAYDDAVAEAKIKPCDKADVEIISVGEDGLQFKAKVTVMPEINVKEYKGLKVEKKSVDITDAEIESEVNNYQQRQSRLIDVEDRKTEMGDTVIFDFEGFVDGVAFEGGKAEKYNLKLGSGQFIPGFEEQMTEKAIGEEFSLFVTFPEEYAEELKGKMAEFKIKLHEIKKEELPTIDDEFAKDVSEFDTLEEFKADLRKKLLEKKQNDADVGVSDNLSKQIAALVEADIPECLFEQEVEVNIQNFERRLTSQGMNLQTYLQYTGQDMEALKTMFRANAEVDVKLRLALEKIAELEKIVISEEEISDEYAKFAESMKTEVEKIKSDYVSERIAKDLTVQKAFELVKNNTDITEEKPKATAKSKVSAKKTAAKKAVEPKSDTAEFDKPVKTPAKKTTAAKTTTNKPMKKDNE